MSPLVVEMRAVAALKPNPHNARTHPASQIRLLAKLIEKFSFLVPILVDENGTILAGHGRLLAAKAVGLTEVPVIVATGMSKAQKRAFILADNRIAQHAGWDREKLAVEFSDLIDLDLDLTFTAFPQAEIDQILLDHEQDARDPLDKLPAADSGPCISQKGDLWLVGSHRLMCGDARSRADVDLLCGTILANAAFLDPPYNVRVSSIVGRGERKHSEFAMASGEMSEAEFIAFLQATLGQAARVSAQGAVHYVCMDWRHIADLIAAGRSAYGELLNLVVWAKTNAGQGSFYRSQHELVGVFRVGEAPHLNNVELGRHGRNRSNVWNYPGVNSFSRQRLDELASHPTVKPVALVADALKDCTKRGDYVLDLFGGSGTTLLAAERVGRRSLLLEYEPRYVDVSIRRWQAFTGKDAVHALTGRTFDETGFVDAEASK